MIFFSYILLFMSVSGLDTRAYANNDIQKQLNDIVETIVQLQVYFKFLTHTDKMILLDQYIHATKF